MFLEDLEERGDESVYAGVDQGGYDVSAHQCSIRAVLNPRILSFF